MSCSPAHSVWEWVIGRIKEPSTYAAVAVAACGVGFLIEQPILIIAGVAVAILAFILKENGVY